MVVLLVIFVLAVLLIGIWMLIELKKIKHKLFAILLIGLILFLYITASFTFKGHDINFKSAEGLIKAGKLYFAFLGGFFGNLKTITTHAIDMNWGLNNETSGK